MTNYKELTSSEQLDVDKQLEKDKPINVYLVYAGAVCCFCYQPEHTCLCGHDED